MHLGGGREEEAGYIIESHESEKLALSTTEQPKLYVGQCNPMQQFRQLVCMSEGCEQAMSRLEELKCILCSGNLAEAGKRRILHCSSNAITDVYKVFKLLVRPTFAPASDVSYVCRRPCFKTLQKLHNHATAINSLLRQLGSPMLSAWRQSTSAETQTASCAEVQ